MAKNIQRKPFTFVAAEDPKINPTATVHIRQVGLKDKTNFSNSLQMPGIILDISGI